VKRGLEFTAIFSELSPLVVFTIPNFNARALMAAGPVSLYPRDRILCLFILDCTMRDKGPQR
jgi:hypothetical protein